MPNTYVRMFDIAHLKIWLPSTRLPRSVSGGLYRLLNRRESRRMPTVTEQPEGDESMERSDSIDEGGPGPDKKVRVRASI